jgi:probable HAF family extracellular repeat protein
VITYKAEVIAGELPFPDVYGLNIHDVLVGDTTGDGEDYAAFVAADVAAGAPASIVGAPDGVSTFLKAVNDSGLAVGTWYGERGDSHAFIYDIASQTFTDMEPYVGHEPSWGGDVNNHGVVVGTVQAKDSTDLMWKGSTFIYDRGAEPPLTFVKGFHGYKANSGAAINDKGEVVGTCFSPDGETTRPYLYRSAADGAEDFTNGMNATAIDINDRGHVLCVHQDFLYSGGQSGPFIWTPDGSVEPVPVDGLPYAINEKDWVVGAAAASGEQTAPYAFLYANGVVYDVNKLLLPTYTSSSLHVIEAFDINNHGHIGAAGWDSDNLELCYGLLLVPEPQVYNPAPMVTFVMRARFGNMLHGHGVGYAAREGESGGRWSRTTKAQLDFGFTGARSIAHAQFEADPDALREALASLERLEGNVARERKARTAAAHSGATESVIVLLERLAALLDRNLISQDEFASLKAGVMRDTGS